jgi:hypothetical protein
MTNDNGEAEELKGSIANLIHDIMKLFRIPIMQLWMMQFCGLCASSGSGDSRAHDWRYKRCQSGRLFTGSIGLNYLLGNRMLPFAQL